MKTISLTFLTFFSFFSCLINAQESRLFMPKKIKQAYENNTRSFDGKPGENYWQNTVDYTIKVSVDVANNELEGSESLVYHNTSPDEINMLVIRLYANVFKKGSPRANSVKAEDLTDGVELFDVLINGIKIDLTSQKSVMRRGTNLFLSLDKPLASGADLTLDAKWKQKIPHYDGREGIIDSTSFFIGYWYPQVSVYDDIFGWDRLNYTLQTEFYNNLANFDVEISAPKNFAVWATGILENPDKVLPKEIEKRFIKAKTSDVPIAIIKKEDIENGFEARKNTWHFTANQVSDFAFALSDHYLWEGARQVIDGRDVFISSVYPNEPGSSFSKLTGIQQKAMKHFSEDFPGIPYPYPSFTTFIGNGGMEFPMMANNGSPNASVTLHEMYHTYFPMYVRINERRWAWMDEGWAKYVELVVNNRYFKEQPDHTQVFSRINFSNFSGTISDLPLITSSQFLTRRNYSWESYSIPANIYGILHHLFGEELFLKCYREYIHRWAKKSPSPYDFFFTFENVSGFDLEWLWKPWFFEFGSVDVAIESFENGKLTIANVGVKPFPLFFEVKYKNGEISTFSEKVDVWAKGNKQIEIAIENSDSVKQITVNTNYTDADKLNNFYPEVRSFYKESVDYKNIVGSYQTEQFPEPVSVLNKDGLFYYSIPIYGIKRLIYPIDKNHFISIDGSMKLEFLSDENGQCTGYNFERNGFKMTAKKIK